MKNILLPTDFSKNSLNAMKYAMMLFKDNPCNFYLLNVFKIPYLTNDELMENDADQLAQIEKDLFDSSQKGLKNIVKKIKLDSKHSFSTLSDYNFFINSVKNTVKSKKIDLIIMGTKGATGAKEIFMGSNTGDVIMKTDCNVLVVPENADYTEPNEITFPTDFTIPYKKKDLKLLTNLVEQYSSNLRILHLQYEKQISTEQEFNRKTLKRLLKNLSYSFHTLTNTDFDTAVNCFTQSRGNINMIAIIARHYNFFQRLFFQPKVEDLSFHSKIPLLVLHKTK